MGKIIKKIIKFVLVLIIVVLNVLIWGRIYISSDAPITKKVIVEQHILDDMKKNPMSYSMKEFFPTITMDSLGKLQMRYVTYIKELSDLQFTLKYNIDYFENNTPLNFAVRHIRGEEQTIYDDIYRMTQDRYIFRYLRFSCPIELQENDSVFVDVYTSDGNLFQTLLIVSPETSSMDIKTVSIKTVVKN